MLSVSTGYDVAYLTGPVASGREGYYTGAVIDAGEPVGLWYGVGAEALGLADEVDAALMEAVYSHLLDPRDPATHTQATWGKAEALAKAHRKYRSADEVYAALLEANPDAGPERRAELRAQAEHSARQAVSFIDVTLSAPKSVTVLGVAFEYMANQARDAGDHEAAQAWSAHHKAVEDAVLAGSRAAIDYLQDQAGYSRIGHHGGGAGRWIDAHQFVVAQFLQHDSRNRDPQLHVHSAILNRVLSADGQWRTLDSQAIKAFRPAAAAVGERVAESYLTQALGVRFATRPDGKAREILGVPQAVMDLFSSRSHQIGPKAEQLLAEYRSRVGREPSALERYRIAQRATLATRAAKSHQGEDPHQRLDRWEAETRAELAGGLAEVADTVLGFAQRVEAPTTWSPQDVIERAIATAKEGRQTFSRAELTRHIGDAVPGHLGLSPEQIRPLLDALTDEAIIRLTPLREQESTEDMPNELVLDNGQSSFSRPGSTLYAAPEQLAAEQRLRSAAVRRGAVAFTADEAAAIMARFAESGCKLGADQAAAVWGVMTSGARVEVLSAAAGTGKSFVVGAIAGAWRDTQRRTFGLASWQAATEVLAEEGLAARNVERWLATQTRLDHAPPRGPDPGEDEVWRPRSGDLVVIDEAGTIDTASLLEVHRRCDTAGAKLLLVGDPRQLAAVGAGGALADIAEHGIRYELAEVRRFRADWEAAASLRLRKGDVEVLDEYAKHGRILDSGTGDQTEAAAARGWLADTLAGRDTIALVPTNAAATRLSAVLRAELVKLGRVEETGIELGRDGTIAGIGDLVQARRNGWELLGHDGNTAAPINRRCYRVTATREDGSLVVAPVLRRADGAEQFGHTLTLPPEYVAEHVTLGYASTVHAAQGRTVDTAHAVIGKGTDGSAAYVALTRGRERNTAYCVTVGVPEDAAPGAAASVEERTGRAVLADILGRDETLAEQDLSATALLEHEAENARSIKAKLDRLSLHMTAVNAARLGTALDELTAQGVLEPEHRVRLAADEALGAVQQLLRTAELAGHNPTTVLTQALRERTLLGARSPAQVLHGRISELLRHEPMTPRITSYTDLIPVDVPADSRAYLPRLASEADDRRRELGTRIAHEQPQWALEALGPVPADVMGREEWEHRAGWAAAYRELADFTDDAEPIGAAPAAGLAEHHAAWRVAHDALHLPEPGSADIDLSDGQLRVRVRAWEREIEWAPKWVADELAATHQQAEQARTDAELSTARADTATDDAQRHRLRAESAAAAERANELAERAATLELADHARAQWFVATAPTRDAAARAKAQLGLRGIALDDLVTAEEWLAAHHADQAADETTRIALDERELLDSVREADEAALDAATDTGHLTETAVLDIRETSTRDASEDADPAQRHRVPTANETTAAIARAQAALAELQARREADKAREGEEARREQLIQWAEQDRTAEQATEADRVADYELVRES
ncbi:MAG: MobF family relaxase [Sciscionella sp.]